MREILQEAHQRNRKTSQSGSDATQVWSAEFPINSRECLRAELRGLGNAHVVLDLRRWYKPPNGTARSTERGFAISVHHLPAIKALINAALTQANVAGLLDESGELRSVSGGAA